MENDVKQENEEKKKYLRQYECALYTERAIEEEIQQVRLDKMFPALAQDGMPHGSGGNSDLSDFMVKVDELLADLKKQVEERIALRREIVQKIEQMDDETEKLVLRLKYIHLKKFEEISVELGYTYRHVIRIHGWALKNFKMS